MATRRVEQSKRIIPEAFHGTDAATAKKIAAGTGFVPTRGNDSYLGEGVYFYEGSMELAKIWATRRRGFKEYGIIQAEVKLGRCLDLNIPEHRRILQQVAQALSKRVKHPSDVTDAAVINYYASEIEKRLDTVRFTHVSRDDRPLYERTIIHRTEPIVCVRNVDNISKISLAAYGVAK